jgi:hypothetical protein
MERGILTILKLGVYNRPQGLRHEHDDDSLTYLRFDRTSPAYLHKMRGPENLEVNDNYIHPRTYETSEIVTMEKF